MGELSLSALAVNVQLLCFSIIVAVLEAALFAYAIHYLPNGPVDIEPHAKGFLLHCHLSGGGQRDFRVAVSWCTRRESYPSQRHLGELDLQEKTVALLHTRITLLSSGRGRMNTVMKSVRKPLSA